MSLDNDGRSTHVPTNLRCACRGVSSSRRREYEMLVPASTKVATETWSTTEVGDGGDGSYVVVCRTHDPCNWSTRVLHWPHDLRQGYWLASTLQRTILLPAVIPLRTNYRMEMKTNSLLLLDCFHVLWAIFLIRDALHEHRIGYLSQSAPLTSTTKSCRYKRLTRHAAGLSGCFLR